MSEPRTHYQISLTARQAVGLFAGLLVALGLAFFFGLMAGLSGRDTGGVEKVAEARTPAERASSAGSETLPPVETGVAPGASGGPSRNDAAALTPVPLEPTAPATLHPFEDSAEEEPAAPAPGSRTSVVGSGSAPPPPKPSAPAGKPAAATAKPAAAQGSGRIWVQAASLSSYEEATALGARLSKHGFHAVVLPAAAPKGRVYRVRVGPYHSEDEAARAMSKLAKQEKIREPWIVPEGK